MSEKEVGYVDHYFGNISVAAIVITDGTVSVGDTLHFVGHTSDFTSEVDSMQIEHEAVEEAGKGDSIGMKTADKVRQGDKVYKVMDD